MEYNLIVNYPNQVGVGNDKLLANATELAFSQLDTIRPKYMAGILFANAYYNKPFSKERADTYVIISFSYGNSIEYTFE